MKHIRVTRLNSPSSSEEGGEEAGAAEGAGVAERGWGGAGRSSPLGLDGGEVLAEPWVAV